MTRHAVNWIRDWASAAAAALLHSVVLWILLTDSQYWNQLWARDIQAHWLSWLGGQLIVTPSGASQAELSWLAVAIRIVGLVGLNALLAVQVSRIRGKPADSPEMAASPSRLWWFRSAVFSLTWLLAWIIAPLEPTGALSSLILVSSPLTFGVSTALMVAGLLSHFPLQLDSPKTDRRHLLIVAAAAVIWQATSFWMNTRLYNGLLVPHGDSAMYEEHLWNVWHGKGFRSYLDQGLFLGEHIQVIHLLLLPLHMALPHYLTLEFCTSVCLAACAIPVFTITRRHSGSSSAAMWMALAWLAYFPMHFLDIAVDLKTLRPSCYGLPFLFLGIDLGERRRFKSASLCLLISLLTQEDFALITGSIGGVFFLLSRFGSRATSEDRRSGLWGLCVLLFSVAWVLAAVLFVIPAFRGGEVVHYSRYFGDLGNSPGDLVRTAIRDPLKVAAVLFSQRTLVYVLVFAIPLAGLPCRAPVRLLGCLATFVMLSLIQLTNSSDGSDSGGLPPVPYHHFHAPLLPVIFWAAAAGLRRRQNATSEAPAITQHSVITSARFAFLCAAGTALTNSLMPLGFSFWSHESPFGYQSLYRTGPRAEQLERILSQIPQTSRVASTDFVHTRLTHYERSYDYSGYPRAVNNYKPGVPPDTDYIIIDTSHRYSTIRKPSEVRELKEESENWELLPDTSDGLFLVLKRVNHRIPSPN